MNRNTLLTQDQAVAFKTEATKLLIKAEGHTWQKKFETAKKNKKSGRVQTLKFKLPVLADILLHDLWSQDGMPKMTKRKLANMIIKKIHDDNIQHVLNLLESFLSDSEMKEYFRSIKKNDMPEEVYGIISKLRTAA